MSLILMLLLVLFMIINFTTVTLDWLFLLLDDSLFYTEVHSHMYLKIENFTFIYDSL